MSILKISNSSIWIVVHLFSSSHVISHICLFWWRDIHCFTSTWVSGWPFWMRSGTLALGLIWQYSLSDSQNGQDSLQYFFRHLHSSRSWGHFPLRSFFAFCITFSLLRLLKLWLVLWLILFCVFCHLPNVLSTLCLLIQSKLMITLDLRHTEWLSTKFSMIAKTFYLVAL